MYLIAQLRKWYTDTLSMANKAERICTYYGGKSGMCQFPQITNAQIRSARRLEKRLQQIAGASLTEEYMIDLEARVHRMPSLVERSKMTGILFCGAPEYHGQITDTVGDAQKRCSEYKEGEPRDTRP
jgi:hypothetical protein